MGIWYRALNDGRHAIALLTKWGRRTVRGRPNFQNNSDESIPVNTPVAYRNLVALADYSNLQDSTVYFSFEDHYARMLVPIR